MGAILACEYALKHRVKTLILCSMTTGVESLADVKADKIIFLAGEKEEWVIQDIQRLKEDLECDWQIVVIPKADHRVTRNYKKKILEIVPNLDRE